MHSMQPPRDLMMRLGSSSHDLRQLSVLVSFVCCILCSYCRFLPAARAVVGFHSLSLRGTPVSFLFGGRMRWCQEHTRAVAVYIVYAYLLCGLRCVLMQGAPRSRPQTVAREPSTAVYSMRTVYIRKPTWMKNIFCSWISLKMTSVMTSLFMGHLEDESVGCKNWLKCDDVIVNWSSWRWEHWMRTGHNYFGVMTYELSKIVRKSLIYLALCDTKWRHCT